MGLLDIFRRKKKPTPAAPALKEIWRGFQQVLAGNNETLVLMGDLEEKLSGQHSFDIQYLRSRIDLLDRHLAHLVSALQGMSGNRWPELENSRARIKEAIHQRLDEHPAIPDSPLLVRLEDAAPEIIPALGAKAGNLVRVKNQLALPVPEGVVATLSAYKLFMEQEHPGEPGTLLARLDRKLASLDLADEAVVEKISRELQAMVLAQPVPEKLAQALVAEAHIADIDSETGEAMMRDGTTADRFPNP